MTVSLRMVALGLLVMAGSPLLGGVAESSPGSGEEAELEPAIALEQAEEESGAAGVPEGPHQLPAGELRVSPSELLASAYGQRIRFSVTLERPVESAVLVVFLPRSWVREVASRLPTTRPAVIRKEAGGAARLRLDGRRVELTLEEAPAHTVASFEVADVGIPAGTYRLPYSWREPGRAATGAARVVLFAPVREAREQEERLADPGQEINASDDAVEESETFIAVTPDNSDRIAVGANWQLPSMSAWISDDAGQNWTPRTLPTSVDAPGEVAPEASDICCDPMFAADALGNIWYGGLSLPNGAGVPSRIVVNRIGAGTNSFQPLTTGLPVRTGGIQDKPMMTIDNSPGSPTFGRLYVVWDEPASGGINLVISQCDTRPAGVPNAARCDNADNWTTPASITPSAGSYIYADVAVGPDGRAYVSWWDYSSTNAIRGDVCSPSSQNCAGAGGWGTPQTIALLDSTGGKPVPFACPIVAQPGGRAAPSPQLDVDHSSGANHGRVYVSWGDLRPGSGTTRCAEKPNGDGTQPQPTHLTWDSFVASAAAGALPGASAPSTSVGTRLISDEDGGASNSDDWFPWLAVDQTTGQAWADLYSTRLDATRETTNFYARSVTPSGGGHTLGTLTRVSTAASDYSGNQCCRFGNDYGDYTGLDATSSIAYPVWTDNSTGEGEAFTFVEQVTLPPGLPPPAPTGLLDLRGPAVEILGKRVRLTAKGRARLRLRCPASEPDPTCAGTLRLKTAHRVAFRGRRRKLLLGARDFEIPAGESRRVGLRLGRAISGLLGELAPLRVLAIATTRDLAGNRGTTRRRLRLTAP